MTSTPERRDRRPVEHVVGDRGGTERDGDQGQERNGARLGEPVVDEPVRGVILPALRHRAPLGEPPDGDERRVEDRDREHEQRQQDRRDRRAGRRPARRERKGGEQEPEQLAARVAHEGTRAAGRPEVERQEAGAGEREGQREHEHEVVLVHGRGVDREVDARDRGERGGEAVHVVEQVERVRDPDEPEERDRDAEHVVRDELDAQARGDREPGGGELRGELRERAQVTEVVDAGPATKTIARAAEDPRELPASARPRRPRARAARRRRRRGRSRRPPNVGVARSCQRSPVGSATSWEAAAGARSRAHRASAATGRAAIVTTASTVRARVAADPARPLS